MLGTELRDFKGEVRCIDNLLRDSRNFISKNHSILPALFRNKFVKHYRTDRLFGTHDSITFSLKSAYGIHSIADMLPCDAVLRPKCRLMNLSRRRHSTNSTKPYLIYLEGVGSTESRANIMGTAHIIQHDYNS